MSLSPVQLDAVREWITAGESLSSVQQRLDAEFGLKLTFMDVRFLVDDLDLTLSDSDSATSGASSESPTKPPDGEAILEPDEVSQPGSVSVGVDAITRPGAIISGSVTFTDGQSAEWQLDQMGRIGLIPRTEGYQPSQEDLAEFQSALEEELRKKGF